MKITRIISVWIVTLAMALSHMPVLALTPVAKVNDNSAEAEKMKTALTAVKGKVEIPENLTEFYSGERNGVFEFRWKDEEDSESLTINCDENGRVTNYRHSVLPEQKEQEYLGVVREQVQAYAEEFMLKLLPEVFENKNDCYVYEGYSCNNDYYRTSYTLEYKRYRNGVRVDGNDARIYVAIYGKNMIVGSLSSNFDYNAVFEEPASEIADPESAYKRVFPLEMIYTDNYVKSKTSDRYEPEVRLIYQKKNHDAKHISAYTGEILEYKKNDSVPITAKNSRVESSADTAAGARHSLSPKEIANLSTIKELMSEEECIEYLKSIPALGVGEMEYQGELSGSDDGKNDYWRRLVSNDEEVFVTANFDIVRRRLLEFYDWRSGAGVEKENVTTKQQHRKNRQIDDFIEIVASDVIGEFEQSSERNDELYYQRKYIRKANGIPYADDTIIVEYNFKDDKIYRYNLNYNNYAEFADPTGAMNSNEAYNFFFEAEPLNKAYVNFGEGYKLTYSIENETQIDAFTGKTLVEKDEYDPKTVEYTDIENHWCRDAVEFLRDIGIALKGDELLPDEPISEEDMLRLFAAGVIGNWLMTADIDEVYSQYRSIDTSHEDIRMDSTGVMRENAFAYMVQFMGYNRIAKLPDIYKVKYADGDMLSDGMVGYAAILSGMGIINGDGSVIRPKDYITRAEALTMVYNYMTSPLR